MYEYIPSVRTTHLPKYNRIKTRKSDLRRWVVNKILDGAIWPSRGGRSSSSCAVVSSSAVVVRGEIGIAADHLDVRAATAAIKQLVTAAAQGRHTQLGGGNGKVFSYSYTHLT